MGNKKQKILTFQGESDFIVQRACEQDTYQMVGDGEFNLVDGDRQPVVDNVGGINAGQEPLPKAPVPEPVPVVPQPAYEEIKPQPISDEQMQPQPQYYDYSQLVEMFGDPARMGCEELKMIQHKVMQWSSSVRLNQDGMYQLSAYRQALENATMSACEPKPIEKTPEPSEEVIITEPTPRSLTQRLPSLNTDPPEVRVALPTVEESIEPTAPAEPEPSPTTPQPAATTPINGGMAIPVIPVSPVTGSNFKGGFAGGGGAAGGGTGSGVLPDKKKSNGWLWMIAAAATFIWAASGKKK